jgi:hypothetical protein
MYIRIHDEKFEVMRGRAQYYLNGKDIRQEQVPLFLFPGASGT